MKALTINETLKFTRGLDPKRAMGIGDPFIRRLKQLREYYNYIKSTKKFTITSDLPLVETILKNKIYPINFGFKAKERIGPDCSYCTNQMHYGERGFFVLEYEKFEDEILLGFQNNGDEITVKSLKDIKNYLGLKDVNESSNYFERGLNPKDAMDIGQKALDKKFIEETRWELPHDIIYQNFNIIKLDRDTFKGIFPILVLKSKGDGDGDGRRYIAVSLDYRTDYYKTPEDALEACIVGIDMYRINSPENKRSFGGVHLFKKKN